MVSGKNNGLWRAIAVTATMAYCGVALADTAVNVTDGKPLDASSIGPIDDLTLALGLANYGVANSDAMSLIAAARMMGGFAVAESDIQPRSTGTDADGTDTTGIGPILSTADDMLAAARALAGDRPDLIAMIDDASAAGARGTRGHGYYYYEDAINPFDALVYDEKFFGGEPAVVTLNGWTETDLDLHIYDEFGNAVCESVTKAASEFCEWMPRWTGQFTVVVLNNGGDGNYYSLWTN